MTPTIAMTPIDRLRRENDDLYERVVRAAALAKREQVNCAAELSKSGNNGSSVLSPECAELKVLLDEVNVFLNHLSALSSNPETVENYLWLCDTAVRWENVFSSMLNLPKSVTLYQPPVSLLPPLPAGDALTKEELDAWVEKCSQVVWAFRIKKTRRYESTQEEKVSDWHKAEVFLASDILDGTLNFARRISSDSYWRLEKVWMFEVRQLLAYLHWETTSGIYFDPSDTYNHYVAACAQIRERLLAPNAKASATEFGEAKRYLEEHYLTADHKLDYEKLRRAGVYNIIAIKADQIRKMTNRRGDKNWYEAETYVKMFYENIIPAVMTDNADNVKAVLNAFHFSFRPDHGYHLTNSFEMALAIYFLNPETVAKHCPF